jgi:Na+-driven multidrug efflux pump
MSRFTTLRVFLTAAPLLAISNAFVPQGSLTSRIAGPHTRSYVRDRPATTLVFEKLDYNTPSTGSTKDDVDNGNEVTPSKLVNENSEADQVTAGLSEATSSLGDTLDNTMAKADSVISEKAQEEMESVSAIFAASGEAVAAAKASVSFSSASNGTETISPLEPIDYPVTGKPNKIVAPRVSKILKFAIPAIGVWLCGPLLSLIDTSTVGLLAGTTQQAALNPACAVTDYAALLIAFLFTGTTNMVASAREVESTLTERPQTTNALIGAIQLSSYVGAGLGAVLFVFARPLLRAIIGNDGISPAVFDAALKYVRIRAIGMPAAAVIGSAQAACLGMQDIRSPLYVLAAAAVVNFIGDMLFVGSSNPLLGGAAGAAWATVFSQFAAVTLFIHWLTNKPTPKAVNVSNAILELTGNPSSKGETRRQRFRDSLRSFRSKIDTTCESVADDAAQKAVRGSGRIASMMRLPKRSKSETAEKEKEPKDEYFSVRGFLDGRFRRRDVFKFPSGEILKSFAPFVIPVSSTQVGRVSGYVAMSHVVSSSFGTTSMAAQSVILSLFYCLCPIADSLSLTAQSFVPSIAGKKPSKERSQALRQTTKNFFKVGGIFGSFMVGAVACIPFLSRFFTSDPAVVALVNMVAPWLFGVFAVHGMICAAEGLLLGQKDLGFLGSMYTAFFAVVPYFMLRVKSAALSGASNTDLTSVWRVFLGYQMFRFFAWISRVAMLQLRSERESAELVERFE